MRVLLLKYLFAFICAAAFSSMSWGQNFNFEYSTLSINEECGLNSRECYFVTKDSKDNLWICTDLGVYKYDGYNTIHYSINDGLLSNVVFEIYEDYKGRIWFLTKSTLLCYLEGGVIKSYEYNSEIIKHCIYPTTDRKKLIVTPNNVYYSVDLCGYFTITNKGQIIENNNPVGRLTLGILEDSLCTIGYKSTKRTLQQILKDKVKYRPLYINKEGNIYQTNADSVERHKKFDIRHLNVNDNDLEGFAILGGALYKFPEIQFLLKDVSCFYPDPLLDNAYWIGTKNGFFHAKFINKRLIKTKNSETLAGNFITSIYCDDLGNTWVTSLEKGLCFLPKQRIHKLEITPFLENQENVRDFEVFKSQLYVSTKFHLVNTNTKRVVTANYSLLQNYKDSLLIASNLIRKPHDWGGMESNLMSIDFTRDFLQKDNDIYLLSNLITKTNVPSKRLEVIYQSNLSKLKDHHLIRFLATENEIYFASSTALFQLKKNTVYLLKNLEGMEISDLAHIPAIGIIISSKSQGLFRYQNSTLQAFQLEENNDLTRNISCIHYSEKTSCLYIGGYQGLIIYHVPSGRSVQLNKNHGFVNSKISIIKEFNDEIFVASFDKIYKVKNEEIVNLFQTKAENTRIASGITGILQDGIKSKSLNQLSYFADFITLNFNVKDYSVWKNKKYQYRLDKKGNWNTILSPEILLPNPRKNFNVEVRYLKSNDTWSDVVINHTVNISPPFYRTFWFYVLIVLLAFIFLFSILRFRLKRKVERLQIANNLLSHQQRLQNARIKPHFIFNVLNSINGHILFNENKQASNYLIKFSQLMRNLLEKSSDDIISLESEVELLHAYLSLEQIRKENKFKFQIDLPNELKHFNIPALMTQPFTENAVIHGISDMEDRAEIRIAFSRVSDRSVRVEICNTGIIPSDQLSKWNNSSVKNAVGITQERIKNLRLLHNNAELFMEIERRDNLTCVVMVLPIIKSEGREA
ncbi:Histidine kinase [Lishizhenia tianjinensis]|uniref:Histidine kinase n=1 Tax=Lishizhenia tianjinensis TaxID=477690 RepID=A0A1I6YL90_9FLAO|nr:histidine kinase [Lishizhenia tianjinensis]SFT51240.1 Histidine kinase [Lishizhenia tianjinensis]